MKKLKFKELNTGYEGEKTMRERKPMTPRRRAVLVIVATLILAFLIVFLLSRFGIDIRPLIQGRTRPSQSPLRRLIICRACWTKSTEASC